MKMQLGILLLCFYSGMAMAEPYRLQQYLESIKQQSPLARSYVSNIQSLRVKVRQAELSLTPEGYAQYNIFDDRKPQVAPQFAARRTDGYNWRVGVKKQTTFGLSGNLYFDSNKIKLDGVSPVFFPQNPYSESRAVLELRQSLLRNSFGESVSADQEAAKASMQAQLYSEQFKLKSLLLEAENLYWTLASYNQVIELQKSNVERAKKTSEWMNRRTQMRLFDQVDALQTQTAYEARLLELQSSIDERQELVRQFNTLRGLDSDQAEVLESLPTQDWMKELKWSSGKGREDFAAMKSMATAQRAQAISSRSQVKPELDLVGTVSTGGLENSFADSYRELRQWDHPSWLVGVSLKVPLNFTLTGQLKSSYQAAISAAEDQSAQANFQEERALKDLMAKRSEAQKRYDKAVKIEKLNSQMVQQERQRLLNGRTTTFQALNFEQNLALSQIQKVRSELVLLQIHNLIKTFEVQ